MAGLSVELEQADDQTTIEPWVTADQLDPQGSVDLDSVCRVATALLFRMSGSQYGVRDAIIRPIWARDCWVLRDYVGAVIDVGQPSIDDRSLVLPGPVRQIVGVKIDGATVPDTQYSLVDRRYLVRGGGLAWPSRQALTLPDSAPGTFSVHFRWGRDVPEEGRVAAQIFARQISLYMNGTKCSLSDKLSTVTRQGTSRTYLDPSEFTRLNRTGLYLVDTWLSAVNPGGGRRRPRVMGPDDPRRHRYE